MKQIISFLLLIIFSFTMAFAIDSPHSFRVTTDFAWYPEAEKAVNVGATHFSPTIGFMDALEARVTGSYTYTIPTPFADNPFVSGNNLKLGAALEVSPVSIMPIFTAKFTPIAFLVFTAGAKMAGGWFFAPMNIMGLGLYNDETKDYDAQDPFSAMYFSAWFEGLFQFDLAAVMPGDWNHVVMQASYKAQYMANTGAEDGQVWKWQGVGEYANGWQYYSSVLLGYQMPLVLQTVAVQAEFDGYYSSDSFAAAYADWNPGFMRLAVSPVAILKFNDKHSLTIQCRFRTRRAFENEYGEDDSTLDQTYTSSEWYWDRLAFSYEIKL